MSQRPGGSGGARGSALSLVSNDSSSSLLAASKRANGSTLKHSTTVEDVPDPEVILAGILGPSPSVAASGDVRAHPITEEDLDLDFDFGGLGLRELANGDAQQEGGGTAYRPQSTEDCRFPMTLTGLAGLVYLLLTVIFP
jgi:vacuolar protein sorting-associated protein 52